jgi:hypothetical protein
MAEKILNSRIVNKHDTEAHWLLATGFTPKQGELIVYDVDDNYNYERIKIGDGVQNVNDLPFVTVDSVNGKTGKIILSASDVGAAPSGYVASRFSAATNDEITSAIESVIADTDDTKMRIARVHVTNSNLDLPGGSWFLTVYKYNDTNYSVVAKHAHINYIARRAMHSGVLGDWEWDNPPMILGTEYRTTELIGKKSVFKKTDSSGQILYRLDGETEWKPYAYAVGAEISGAAVAALTDAKSYTDSEISNLSMLIGDVAVSEQIGDAFLNNQGDWWQNDSNQANYIKNRPFYSEDPVEEPVLASTSLDFNGDDAYFGDFSVSIETELLQAIEPGVEYVVTFDGTEYRRTAFIDGFRVVIGNAAFVAGTDTGEPFAIDTHGGTLADICVDNSNQSVHTISITAIKVNVHKIDMKYIPDCLMPKTTYVELEEYEWIDDGSLLYQVVEIGGVTANSKVDLQPTAYQILDLQNNDIAFVLENNDGVVTAYCLGGTPNKSYTMQVLITEVLPI